MNLLCEIIDMHFPRKYEAGTVRVLYRVLYRVLCGYCARAQENNRSHGISQFARLSLATGPSVVGKILFRSARGAAVKIPFRSARAIVGKDSVSFRPRRFTAVAAKGLELAADPTGRMSRHGRAPLCGVDLAPTERFTAVATQGLELAADPGGRMSRHGCAPLFGLDFAPGFAQPFRNSQ